MRVIVAVVILTAIVAIVSSRWRANVGREEQLGKQIEQATLKLSDDFQAGYCDFATLYHTHNLSAELAKLKGYPWSPYPYTRTSGVVPADELPLYTLDEAAAPDDCMPQLADAPAP